MPSLDQCSLFPGLLIRIDFSSFRHPARQNPDGTFAPSPDQQAALDKLATLLLNRRAGGRTVLVLTGYAGTGKTTVMKLLVKRLEEAGQKVVLLAPTGKAASRLKQTTGRSTGTVHSFIYGKPEQIGVCPACKAESATLGMSVVALRQAGLTHWVCPSCATRFSPNQDALIVRKLPFTAKKRGSDDDDDSVPTVAIVDEASMVDTTLAGDIESFLPQNYAVLYVGDKGQLPPVGGRWGANFDRPDAALTTVHRQTGDSPILNLATRIREGKNRSQPFAVDPDVVTGKKLVVGSASAVEAANWLTEQRENLEDATLLAYTNRTRQALNGLVRNARGLSAESNRQNRALVRSDRVLVLANNRETGLTNGEVVVVEDTWFPKGKLRDDKWIWVRLYKRGEYLLRQDFLGIPYANWRDEMWPYVGEVVNAEKAMNRVEDGKASGLTPAQEERAEAILDMGAEERFDTFGAIAPRDLLHADYGECITVHKSQGSQWKNVGLIWDYPTKMLYEKGSNHDPDEGVRWLYTAVTRASDTLVVFRI